MSNLASLAAVAAVLWLGAPSAAPAQADSRPAAPTAPPKPPSPATPVGGGSAASALVVDLSEAETAAGREEIGPRYGGARTDHWTVAGDAPPRIRRTAARVLETAHRDLKRRFFRSDPRDGLAVAAANAATAPQIAAFLGVDARGAAADGKTPAPVLLRARARPTGPPDDLRLAEHAARRFLDVELPRAPVWIREALAASFAPATIDEDGRLILGGADGDADPADALALHRKGRFREGTIDAVVAALDERVRFRGVKYAAELGRMLLRDGDAKFTGLLARLRDGATFDAAFRAAAALPGDRLAEAISAHFADVVAPALDLRELKTERQFATFVKHRPEEGRGKLLLGRSLGLEAGAADAAAAFRGALADRRFAHRREAWAGLAAALFAADDRDGARAAAARAWSLQDARFDFDVETAETYGKLLRAAGDKDAARAVSAAIAVAAAEPER